MKFDLSKVISAANAISSPKQAVGVGLNMLAKKNPEMANTLSVMIKSGENPVAAIQRFSAEGKISTKELTQIKNIYSLARKAGFQKFAVPDSVWAQAEAALSGSGAPVNTSGADDWF